MKLVIGGAFQGKLEYAKQIYQIEDGWIDGRDCPLSAIETCRGIHQFQEYLRRLFLLTEAHGRALYADGAEVRGKKTAEETLLTIEADAEQFIHWLTVHNPDIILVSDEVGYGVVPLEKQERTYREVVGRVCTCAAAQADEVTRVVCGIGRRIK
jgi:adenosylcobinamide kinase/adenosylcobinamide-phosphate guanylyltransferase